MHSIDCIDDVKREEKNKERITLINNIDQSIILLEDGKRQAGREAKVK